jgi:outer membrane protein assembly factor BamE (lipoprotein component of BamABCDE complex)
LPIDIQGAIKDGRVIKGMTKADVEAVWGKPSSTADFSVDPEAWWYEKGGEGWWYKTLVGTTYFVGFNNNLVSQIDSYLK